MSQSSSDVLAVIQDKLRSRNQPHKGQKMVGWYNIGQLARTALEVVISSTLGRHNDRRFFQSLEFRDRPEHFNDFTIQYKYDPEAIGHYVATPEKREEVWIDYVSDLGDGWDSSYAVAYYLSKEKLTLDGENTKRGEILIMGGDEVYPTATREEYENRLERPFRAAMTTNEPGKHPFLFAIPGNHDWYDSLSNFSRIFLTEEYFAKDKEAVNNNDTGDDRDNLPGRWRTPQERSYFVLKLPHGWWLVGIDLQLDSDLDTGQIEYLRAAARDMSDGDKIILCSPEPYWVFAEIYKDEKEFDSKFVENRLNKKFLEDRVFTQFNRLGKEIKKQKIAVYVAGDLHHYYHLETDDQVHKITAGGGGAFLHPTHGPLDDAFKKEFRAAFPTSEESQQYTKVNLLFPFLNRTFGFVTMILYLLSSWSVWAFVRFNEIEKASPKDQSFVSTNILPLSDPALNGFRDFNWFVCLYDFFNFWIFAFEKTLLVAMRTPIVALWALIIAGGFYLFTDSNSKHYRMYGSLGHGILHVIAAFIINWSAYWLTVRAVSRPLTFQEWMFYAGFTAIGLAVYCIWQKMHFWLATIGSACLLFISTIAAGIHENNKSFLEESYQWGGRFDTPRQIFFGGLLIAVLSYFVGAFIFGAYLWFSLRFFDRHSNEAFSSLGIQDWKNFLRLHINKEGYLTIYPIGIQRVPRHWETIPLNQGGSTYEPADPNATPPTLIERPIIIDPPLFS